jgi:Fe-S cluster biogenesis protein NfuA
MLEKVLATIEVIRPVLQADGGDVELVGVDEETGVVSVRLIGACGTCPVSTQTLKGGIERIMRDRVDGVTEVVDVAAAENVIWWGAPRQTPKPYLPQQPKAIGPQPPVCFHLSNVVENPAVLSAGSRIHW